MYPVVNVDPPKLFVAFARHGFVSDDEYQYDAHVMPQPTMPVIERLHTLEDKFKSLEVHTILGLDVVDMCLVPGLLIPQKFKVPDCDKYKRISCPKTHLRAYYRKMATCIYNDQLLIHYFQDNLSGTSLEWYMQLEIGQVQSWRDLAESFLKHYQYNTYLAPNLT